MSDAVDWDVLEGAAGQTVSGSWERFVDKSTPCLNTMSSRLLALDSSTNSWNTYINEAAVNGTINATQKNSYTIEPLKGVSSDILVDLWYEDDSNSTPNQLTNAKLKEGDSTVVTDLIKKLEAIKTDSSRTFIQTGNKVVDAAARASALAAALTGTTAGAALGAAAIKPASHREIVSQTVYDYVDQTGDSSAESLGSHIDDAYADIAACSEDIMDNFNKFLSDSQGALAKETPSIFDDYLKPEVAEYLDKLFGMDADAAAEARSRNAAWKEAHTATNINYSKFNEDFNPAIVYKEQCFLLAKIFDIAKWKKETLELKEPKTLPFAGIETQGSNASLMLDGEPFAFINKLTQYPSNAKFFEMTTDQISHLVPMMRFFKITQDDKEGSPQQREINFDSYATTADVESIFKDKDKRGFGVGIKDFSFTYDGNNPFAAKKSIKAKLTIFANSFDELLKDRGGYCYLDLALRTGSVIDKTLAYDLLDQSCGGVDEKYNKIIEEGGKNLNFILKALVGWARPNGANTFSDMSDDDKKVLLDAISDSYATINLTPTVHEFKIDDYGRVNFIINYLAYVEDFFDQAHFNTFSYYGTDTLRMGRKLEFKAMKRGDCGSQKVSDAKKKLSDDGTLEGERKNSMQYLLTRLYDRKRLFNISLSKEDISEFKVLGPYYKANETIVPERSVTDLKSKHLMFFYVSDLIDTIMQNIQQSLEEQRGYLENLAGVEKCDVLLEQSILTKFYANWKRFRVILGPLEIVNPVNPSDSTYINFGDVPISVKYFNEWITKSFLKKERDTYSLTAFLNNLFNDLINNFLNDDTCFSLKIKQKSILNQSVITSYNDQSGTDEVTDIILDPPGYNLKEGKRLSRAILDDKSLDLPILNISGPKNLALPDGSIAGQINYLVYFASRTKPNELMTGDVQQDSANGIFHYMIGRQSGIVKSISFNKTEAKYLAELRFEQDGYDGLQQLRLMYNVSIRCYANVKVYPGTYIYVDPRGFAPNTKSLDGTDYDLTRYGIGGYYVVYKSETTFSSGQAETTITAQWVAETTANLPDDTVINQGAGVNDEITKKCGSSAGSSAASSAKDTSWFSEWVEPVVEAVEEFFEQ
jgi:hypothetical protein